MICTPCNRSTEADICDAPAAHNPYGWVDGVRWCELFALRPTQPSLFAPAPSPPVGQGSLTGTADTPTAAVSVSTTPDLPEGGAL